MRHKHCPFCGYNNNHAVVSTDNINRVRVVCRECGAMSGEQFRQRQPGPALNQYDILNAYAAWDERHEKPKAEIDHDDDGDNAGYSPDDWGDR